MPNPKTYLDQEGLQLYHENLIKALQDKAAKEHVHVGSVKPTDSNITVWFDTSEQYSNPDSSGDDKLVLYGLNNLTEALSLDDGEISQEELILDRDKDTLVLDDSENLREELVLDK